MRFPVVLSFISPAKVVLRERLHLRNDYFHLKIIYFKTDIGNMNFVNLYSSCLETLLYCLITFRFFLFGERRVHPHCCGMGFNDSKKVQWEICPILILSIQRKTFQR